jgi:hypothetical protein
MFWRSIFDVTVYNGKFYLLITRFETPRDRPIDTVYRITGAQCIKLYDTLNRNGFAVYTNNQTRLVMVKDHNRESMGV